MAGIYKKIIWQHYQHPRNLGKLKAAQKFEGKNPFCGDELVFYIKLDKNERIKEVAWEGKGCAISQAAASIFSEMIKGKTLRQVQNISHNKFLKKLEEPLSPTRTKCALLPIYILKKEDIN